MTGASPPSSARYLYKGNLGDVHASFDYSISDNVDIGLGGNGACAREDGFNGRTKWRYGGALADVKLDS